jgi:hypothetical protein
MRYLDLVQWTIDTWYTISLHCKLIVYHDGTDVSGTSPPCKTGTFVILYTHHTLPTKKTRIRSDMVLRE